MAAELDALEEQDDDDCIEDTEADPVSPATKRRRTTASFGLTTPEASVRSSPLKPRQLLAPNAFPPDPSAVPQPIFLQRTGAQGVSGPPATHPTACEAVPKQHITQQNVQQQGQLQQLVQQSICVATSQFGPPATLTQQQQQQVSPPAPSGPAALPNGTRVASHVVNLQQQYLQFSMDFEILAHLGSGGFSNIYAAKFRGIYAVQQQDDPFFVSSSNSAAVKDALQRELLAKLPADSVIALKVSISYDDLEPARQVDFPKQRWNELQQENMLTEAEVCASMADCDGVIGSFGLCKLQLLTPDGQLSSSSSWSLALMLEKAECSLASSLNGSPADPATCHTIMTAAAQVLVQLHRKVIIWRDLKAANILICQRPDGTLALKAADFGLAHIMRHSGDFTTAVVGTRLVMPPEVRNQQAGDIRIDVHLLGGLFIEIRFGKIFEYLRTDPDVTVEDCVERLSDWEWELSQDHCPYKQELSGVEYDMLLGCVAYDVGRRLMLEQQFTEQAQTPYFLSEPYDPVADVQTEAASN